MCVCVELTAFILIGVMLQILFISQHTPQSQYCKDVHVFLLFKHTHSFTEAQTEDFFLYPHKVELCPSV